MAAITASYDSAVKASGAVERWYGTGTANQADTLSSAAVGKGYVTRLVYVGVHYSNTATYTGTALTVKIDSGLGASFDVQLGAGTDNAEDFTYSPDEEIFLFNGDAIIVAAPAGGSGVTASVVIVTERV